MNPRSSHLKYAFRKNRTEEYGDDVYSYFVIPPFYNDLDLTSLTKSVVIEGGRGCGKTMLLRYLCYPSFFSPERRAPIQLENINHIGLYWRVDTTCTSLMTNRGIADDQWISAFEHLIALSISKELIQCLKLINEAPPDKRTTGELENLRFGGLAGFDPLFDANIQDMFEILTRKTDEFRTWLSNVSRVPQPLFLPSMAFLRRLIELVKGSIGYFKDTIFRVYIDEYETLREYQQEVINTYIKHSQLPLLFNIAIKKYGFKTRKTLSDQRINDIADFRTVDLEQLTLNNFITFGAEVLLLKLSNAGETNFPIDVSLLKDRERLDERSNADYQKTVRDYAKNLFPGITVEEIGAVILQDDALRDLLQRRITKALKDRMSNCSSSQFVRPLVPLASITTMALLHRKRNSPEEVLEEIGKLEAGKENKFTGPSNWIHNNAVGCILSLYAAYSRPCPFYSGFESFCQIARGNLRHFLELCHLSIQQQLTTESDSIFPISLTCEATAARQTSAQFLGEVESYGNIGPNLHSFVLALGSLFALGHARPSQSEPEQSHFSITEGSPLTCEDKLFLHECVSWSVLIEEEETKKKTEYKEATFEYVLNPIYAPYFFMTYRKKRKLELSSNAFRILKSGDYDQVNRLLKDFSNKWEIDPEESSPTLFSHLYEGDE